VWLLLVLGLLRRAGVDTRRVLSEGPNSAHFLCNSTVNRFFSATCFENEEWHIYWYPTLPCTAI
jgi:hypothetical protein